MERVHQLGDARRGKLLPNLVGFGRALRRAGVPIDASRIALAAQAMQGVGLQRKDDLSAALEAVLVGREQDPQNRRALKLALTAEGLALLQQGEEAMLGVEADMFGAMPARDREALRATFLALHDRMSPASEAVG